MKLVRAKLKQNFESVLRAQCCPEYLTNISNDPIFKGELIVDLDNWVKEPINCAYCHKPFGIVHGVTNMADGLLVPLDLFDLDEGEYNADRNIH